MPARALPMPILQTFAVRPLFLCLILAFACAGTPSGSSPTMPAPPSAEPSGLAGETWEAIALSDMPLEIALPAAARWRQSRSGSFALLEDARTRSKLMIRVWRAARLVQPAECEAEARLARPDLSVTEPSALIEERALTAPRGFHGVLRVAAVPAEVGQVKGVVVAVGAAVGRCYFAALETRDDGDDAPATVADRLAAMVSSTFEAVRIVEVEERVLTTPRG